MHSVGSERYRLLLVACYWAVRP